TSTTPWSVRSRSSRIGRVSARRVRVATLPIKRRAHPFHSMPVRAIGEDDEVRPALGDDLPAVIVRGKDAVVARVWCGRGCVHLAPPARWTASNVPGLRGAAADRMPWNVHRSL